MFKPKKNKTMKKIYQAPVTEEVKIELQRMIADSIPIDNETEIGGVGEITSREGSSFFDDDDEDY